MKKLTIIRHAKSDWSFDLPDMERPISKRGKNDVKIMCEELLANPVIEQYTFEIMDI